MDVTHFVVPGHLTADQATAIRRELLDGPILDPADMFARLVKIVGSPVQSCMDVETTCWLTPDHVAHLRRQQANPTIAYASVAATSRSHSPEDVALVRRTDVAAQIAMRDAEIARLRDGLTRIMAVPDDGAIDPEDGYGMSAEMSDIASAVLNEGTAG